MQRHLEVRRGSYHDSVTLMRVSRAATEVDGADAVLVAMATELNLGLLADLGFTPKEAGDAGPNDLLVAVRAVDDDAVARALAAVDAGLAERTDPAGGDGLGAVAAPRTVAGAIRRQRSDLALVSVPGPDAFVEAMDALRAGLHVMVFSDNVPVEQEVALKDEAGRRGLLVMGPDCGTAMVGGVGLGFANAVRPGPVGIVAASGTGAQQVACLLDGAGVGLSHLLGVGGRDLSAQVGAASTLQALAALDADPATELIAILSKPPDPVVAERVREAAGGCSTPVVLGFVGRGERDLTAVAAEIVGAVGGDFREPRQWAGADQDRGGYEVVRGLFAGGTLCDEAMVIVADALGPVRSNIPLEPDWRLGAGPEGDGGPREGAGPDDGHVFIDFGDDELTRGRPHPMIDQGLRLERLAREAADPRRKVVLLDVVLGHGAHPDPAAELAPAIVEARVAAGRSATPMAVVISLCGSAGDPQPRDRQAEALAEAGASVHLSNATAARAAVTLVGT